MTSLISEIYDIKRTYTHSPILIHFLKPVLRYAENEQTENVMFGDGNKLLIECPPSANDSYKQIFPSTKISLQIPTNGILRFKLMPTTAYTPNGRYKVSYIQHGVSHPVFEEEWKVDPVISSLTATMTHDSSSNGDEFSVISQSSYGIFEILSVDHPGEYKIENDRIKWLSNPPNNGQTYRVTYVPALTLKHLKVETHSQKERGWVH